MVIAPWEIEQGYPLEDWVETALQLSTVQTVRARKKAEAAYLENFRRNHKDYAGHHYKQ